MNDLIRFENISLSYQTPEERVDIFSDLNLSIQEGEFIVIVGPSGSGKSSILNLIAGFIKPTSGNILFKDKNIAVMNEQEICEFRNKKIGYIFQFFNLLQQFTAEDNVAIPLIIANESEENIRSKVNNLLEKVNLSHRKKHYPPQLSGGEQQRVAIARALATNPDIILADEPTGNLDQKTGKIILEMLKEIHNEGKTIIVVTHDLTVTELATKVIDIKTIAN